MKSHTSNTVKWVKGLIILPVLAVLIYSFSSTKEVFKPLEPDVILSKTPEGLLLDDSKQVSAYTIVHSESPENNLIESRQNGASKEQIAEYNKLAKHYNSQKGSNYTIKLSDIKRIKYLYDLMTEEQRKSAEPFPNFPTPPPPPEPEKPLKSKEQYYKVRKNSDKQIIIENGKAREVKTPEPPKSPKNGEIVEVPPPPPPPVPANATKEQKEKYKEVSEEYYKKYKVENGKAIKREPLPPAPPKPEKENPWGITTTVHELPADKKNLKTPPFPSEHMKQLSEKNATFYYNNKTISGEEAVKLTSENHNLHIVVSSTSSNHPIVKISDRNPNIEKSEIVEVPPPPPPPKSPLDYVIDMAKKGAKFYYEGKKISLDKAIEILKANKSMNISTKNSGSKNPKVYLSKEPITIKEK